MEATMYLLCVYIYEVIIRNKEIQSLCNPYRLQNPLFPATVTTCKLPVVGVWLFSRDDSFRRISATPGRDMPAARPFLKA